MQTHKNTDWRNVFLTVCQIFSSINVLCFISPTKRKILFCFSRSEGSVWERLDFPAKHWWQSKKAASSGCMTHSSVNRSSCWVKCWWVWLAILFNLFSSFLLPFTCNQLTVWLESQPVQLARTTVWVSSTYCTCLCSLFVTFALHPSCSSTFPSLQFSISLSFTSNWREANYSVPGC